MKMTAPIFVESLLAMLVGNIDQVMIARYSEDCVTAVGNANQVLNLLVLTFTVISLATTVLITQYIGAKRQDRIGQVYTLAIFVNLVLSVLISAFLVIGSDLVFDFLHPPEEVRANFKAYLTIVGGTLFLQAMFTTFSAIFKSNAMMRQIMVLSVVMNVVNVVVNWLLIYGVGPFPELGIRGVALGTVVGRLIAVALVIFLYYKQIRVSLSPRQLWPFPHKIMRKMFVIGLPSGGESISYNFTVIVIMLMINRFGKAEINTKLYASMFAMITWMFASSISQASQILVGYCMGARRLEDADKQVKFTLRLSVVITIVIGTLLWLCSEPLFGIVTKDPQVVALGKTVLMIDIVLETGRAINMVMVRALQAAGDINFPIGMGIISTWIIAVGGSFVLGVVCGLGLKGIWIAMACDEMTRGLIFVARWKSGVWRTKNVIADT